MEDFYANLLGKKVMNEYEPDLIKRGIIPIPLKALRMGYFDTLKRMFDGFDQFDDKFDFISKNVEQMEKNLILYQDKVNEEFELFSNFNIKDETIGYILNCNENRKIKPALDYISRNLNYLKNIKLFISIEDYKENEYYGHYYRKINVSDNLLAMIETLDEYLNIAINQCEEVVKLYGEQPTPEQPTKKDLLLYYDFTKEKEQFDNDTQFYEEITKKYGYSKQGMKNAKGQLNDKIYLTDKNNLLRLMKLMEGKDDGLKNLNEFLKLNRIA